MRFVKVIFGSLLGIFAVVFILENRTVLEHAVQLRFDIYVLSLQTANIPLWVLILFTFFLGVFTASLYGIYELLKQRQTIRHLRHNVEILGEELKRAGVMVKQEEAPEASAAGGSTD
jgi:uncharacterized integral membrane protein|uniref:LapA family protein n=1 Tax=Desulfobacca acetoxidans TaxID=60893 RepID=A0A7V6DP83_9BACT